MLIDTHAHLNDEIYSDIKKVIDDASSSGVKKIICSGYDVASSKKALELAHKYPQVFATVGIFPGEVDHADLGELESLIKDEKTVGIGEIGLEFREGKPDTFKQEGCFMAQLELAYKYKKPIVIHCREAIGRMLELLKQNREKLIYGGTLHCFTESQEVAAEIVKLGLHISIGGVSTFKNAKKVKEAVIATDLKNIILETDCPYLSPEPKRAEVNQPMYLSYIAENIAKLKGINTEEVISITTQNARRLFKI